MINEIIGEKSFGEKSFGELNAIRKAFTTKNFYYTVLIIIHCELVLHIPGLGYEGLAMPD